MRRTPEYLLGLVVLTAVYYGAAELGTSLAFADNATTVWPPVGILAAVVAVFGFRWLPAVAAGEIVATIAWGTPLEVAVLQLVGNVGEVALAAFILRRLCGGRPQFKTLGDIGALIAAAVPAAIVSATLGTLALQTGDLLAGESFETVWYRWVLADIASMLLVIPLVAVAVDSRAGAIARRHPLETVTVAVLTIACSVAALVISDVPLTYAVFPVLAWAALRLGRLGAAAAGFIAAAIAVAGVAAGEGPFAARATEDEALILAQTFIVVASLTTLALAIVNSQRVRAANERASSLAELQAILSAAPAVIFVKDLAGRYKLASDHLRRIWGDQPVVGQTDADLMPPDVAATIQASDKRLVETRVVEDVEGVVPEPRGERIYRVQRFPVVGPDDEVRGVGGIALDVTEQRTADAQRKRSEELLARTAELGRVGGWGYDVATATFSWSAEMYKLHGVDPETHEVTADAWAELTHPDDRDRARKIFADALQPGRPDNWESRRRTIRPDGEVRVLLGRGQVQRDDSGAAVSVSGFDQDITDLAAAEEELRRGRELLERMAQLGSVGGWAIDLKTSELTWSAQQYRLYGLDPDEFEPTNDAWTALLHPDDRERAHEVALQTLATHAPWDQIVRIIRPDGEVRHVRGRGEVECDEHNEPVLLRGFQQDVTDLVAAEEELRRSEDLLTRTAALGQIGGWVHDMRTNELTWSAEEYNLYGLDPATHTPDMDAWFAMIHPDDRERSVTLARAAIEGRDRWDFVRRVIHTDGGIRWLRCHGEAEYDEYGEAVRIRGFEQDITDRETAQQELQQAERRYRSLVERLPAVSYVCEAGPQGRWSYVSPQIERMVGYTPEEWIADPTLWERCLHADDRERVLEVERRGIATGAPMAVEYRMQARDGRTLWIRDEALVRPDDDHVYLDGMLTDITERKAFETQLQFLADHDPLTGLYNRRRFVEELELESKLAVRDGHSSTVVMLDLDNFKYINDALGHRAGDVLIRGIADTLERRLRETDTLARLGGDEFAALLRGTSPDEARVVVAEVLEAIRERTHALSDEPVRVTASAGMVALDGAAASAEELLAFADLAMYEAKQTGRDRVAIFSPELHQEIRSGRSWADRIRMSLDGDGFELFCQPIVDLSTDRVSQWEVLLRMRADDGKIVAPDAFLPLAERFDLIQQIDRWVALEAIALMERRLEIGERVRLEVNLSAKSLVDPEFMTAVESAVRTSRVDPADLIFEVTETAAIANMDEARAFSERLRRLGCGFALDDFGSGFASFYYLKHLPVDYVKIDGDFVRGLTGSTVDQQVVKAMIAIAKALGQKTVAEFVGDQPTVELLRSLGVDYVQGYYLGVPVPADRMTWQAAAPEPA